MKILSILTALFLGAALSFAGETITLNGQQIRNCDLVEIGFDGVLYRSGDTNEIHNVPWDQLSTAQQATIRQKHNAALVNAICDARYVDGSVFHANKDGVVVQITLKDEGDSETGVEGFHQGARVLKGGIVLISDLPNDVPRSAGDPIKVIAYYKEKSMFDMGIAEQEIEHLTVAKPEWFQFTEWRNTAGVAMKARLLGIKGDKVLFLKEDTSRFVYNLSQLDAESQEKAKEVHAKLAKFPVP